MLLSRTTAARAVWFNVGFVMLAVGVFDASVGSDLGKQQKFGNSNDLFALDDLLGVRPKAGLKTTASMVYDGEKVYDVVYTFDEFGLRVSPQAAGDASQECILFFGDSYTFGEGVEDHETMPYRVGTLTGGRYAVRNFAFSGYGPHQMLAAIEGGLVERAARCLPRYAIVPTHYHHALRAAGVWTWDRHGPRYVLNDNGRPVRSGNFDSDEDPTRVLRALEKSAVADKLRRRGMDLGANDATPEDVVLYRAIVLESHDRLRKIWPDLEFHIILWDAFEGVGHYPLFDERFNAAGITIHSIGQILPPVANWDATYKLPRDIHPNAHAHDLIAQYVVREILKIRPEAP
jgi:hypothetical protein